MGEVSPEGGVIIRYEVPLPRETEDAEQAHILRKLVEDTLEPPNTLEAALSVGKGKHENSEWACRIVGQTTSRRNRKYLPPSLRKQT